MSQKSPSPAGSGLLIVDKPAGMTSHDVVSRARRLLRTRKIGHAGTLDPMATGVLVLGVEKATKLLGYLTLDTKAYLATIRLGVSTSTEDADGEVMSTQDASDVTLDRVREAMADLTGRIQQVPSAVSAIKVRGRRAYELARAGEHVELDARPVDVSEFELLEHRSSGEGSSGQHSASVLDLDVRVHCSSGTYVRALARDLGAALGVGGHLTALRRTQVGPFALSRARTLPDLEKEAADAGEATRVTDAVPRLSLGLDEAVGSAFPTIMVDDSDARALSYGQWLSAQNLPGTYAALDGAGRALALLRDQGEKAKPVLVLAPANT